MDNLTEAFTSIYLHCTCVHMCILHRFYVYLMINWLFRAIKNITKIDFLQLNLYNHVDFYKYYWHVVCICV